MDKEKQDSFLSSTLRKKECKSTQIKWNCFLKLKDLSEVKVCFKFIIQLFQISKQRLTTVKTKCVKNCNFIDMRGRKSIEPKIKKELFDQFINLVPKTPSHYTSSQKMYFSNRELNLAQLLIMYKEFLVSNNQDNNISRTSFTNFFKNNYNIKFKHPRSDVCDTCFEKERNIQNLQFNQAYNEHINNFNTHSLLKKQYLKGKNYIVIEFDYSQNKPLPKLPNSSLFYKRLLWLYIFNIHVYQEQSYIFYSLEGDSPKNSNSVCSSLFKIIEKLQFENKLSGKEIVFLSDNTCAQNKNWIITRFCSYLSIKFNINIIHFYPVRGHTYSRCDLNFSLMSNHTRKLEIIENFKTYLEVYEKSDKFTVLKAEVFDYSQFLLKYFSSKCSQIKIMKTVKFEYFPCGKVVQFSDYNNIIRQEFNLILANISLDNIKNLTIDCNFKINNIGISKEKRNDILSILKYISSENVNIYENHLKNIDKTCDEYYSDSDNECDQ